MRKERIGFAMCGSFCTFAPVLEALEELHTVFPDIIPIMSDASYETDSRFGDASSFRERLEAICSHEILHTIPQVEPIGPKKMIDALVIAPCSGTTAAKIANAISDTTVSLAAKSTLRNNYPVILAISTNDGLAGSAKNIGLLLNTRGIYFVPYRQDDPDKKPRSVVADMNLILPTLSSAMAGRQLQPILC